MRILLAFVLLALAHCATPPGPNAASSTATSGAEPVTHLASDEPPAVGVCKLLSTADAVAIMDLPLERVGDSEDDCKWAAPGQEGFAPSMRLVLYTAQDDVARPSGGPKATLYDGPTGAIDGLGDRATEDVWDDKRIEVVVVKGTRAFTLTIDTPEGDPQLSQKGRALAEKVVRALQP